MKTPLLLTAGLLAAATATGQVLPPPGSSPAPAQSSPSGGGGGTSSSSSGSSSGGQSQQQGGLFGSLLPHVDSGSETVTWDGKMWNMNNNRLMRSKFEIYLATPEANTADDQAYRDLIAQITQLLAPTRQGGPDVSKAFALLPEAGSFRIDAGICNTIANGVYDVWLAQRKVNNLRAANDAMLKRRGQLEWNSEQAMNNAQMSPSNSGGSSKSSGGNRQQANQQQQGNNMTMGRVSGYIKSMAEIEARMKLNETAIGVSEVTSKIQFQALMVQMFMQRRFEHAIIACRLYPHMFKDGDSVLQLDDNSDLKKMFSAGMGVPPTVAMIDGFASEAIRGVDEAVVAFDQLVLRQDYHSASNRLMEAYAVGEYLPRIRTLPMAQKLKVLDYVRDGNQLVNALEMRDFGLAEELVKKLRAGSKDFDFSKPQAAIETARALCDMRLTAAKAAILKGDQVTYATELKAAAEIWPTNPKLRDLSEMVGQNSDVQAQALLDLDRLLSQRNYRQIFNDQGRFLAASINDPARQEQLAKVLKDMNRVNMVVHAAGEATRNGNSFGAWEAIEREFEQFPEDPEITRMRGELSVKASEFVSAIQRAKEHEQRKQTGSALAWYLKARRMYPPSEFARNGIQRLVTALNGPTGEVTVQ
jgi:tetratricopeptide (TPR) repeat protein